PARPLTIRSMTAQPLRPVTGSVQITRSLGSDSEPITPLLSPVVHSEAQSLASPTLTLRYGVPILGPVRGVVACRRRTLAPPRREDGGGRRRREMEAQG